MSMTTRCARIGAALAIALTALTAVAVPAGAGSSGQSRSTGSTASVQWIEVGRLSGIRGNVHVGDMFIDASTRVPGVYGSVFDWSCPPGELPPHGGGHHFEEPPPETNCIHRGVRFIEGHPSLEFTMDQELTSARLTGNLTVSSHGSGGGVAYPPVDMTLTGFGPTITSRLEDYYTDGTYTYWFRYSSTFREATVTGVIGPMNFTDDRDDVSSASMGTYRSMDRWRSR